MGSGNPSVELAPLRGSIEFNLDAFEELESSINDLKDNLEDLSSNIEFTSNIDNLVEQFNDLTDRLSDLNEHLTISSNIDNIIEQIDVLKQDLLDMDATIHIDSNISEIIEESNNLKDELDDLTEHLTISSNIDNIIDQVDELKDITNLDGSLIFSSNIDEIISELDEAKDLVSNLASIDEKINFTSNIEEVLSTVDNLKTEISELDGKIEFSINTNTIMDDIDQLKNNLVDIDSTIHITSNIPEILEQADDLREALSRSFNVEINSNISSFESKIDELNDNLQRTQEFTQEEIEFFKSLGASIDEFQNEMSNALNISANEMEDDFTRMEENATELKAKVARLEIAFESLKSVAEFNGNINVNGILKTSNEIEEAQEQIAKFMNELQSLVDEGDISGEAFVELKDRVADLSNEMFDYQETLKETSDNLNNLGEACKEQSDSLESLAKGILSVDIKLKDLKEDADIKGNIDIEGLRTTSAELNELQNKLAEVSAKAIDLHEAGEIDDDGLLALQGAASDTTLQMSSLQDHVNGTIESFKEGQAPVHTLRGRLVEFGKSSLESGQNALWTGQMISSMMSPIRTVGEDMFELGLKTTSALTITKHMFGSSSTQVERWSKNTVNSMGLAEGAALSTVEKFGMSARTLGANKKQAALLAEGYTQLAQHIDLGTQGTISYQTAASACLQAMAGQTYGLKALGISFSTSNENAEAAALGYHKAYKSLSPVQQATVRLKLAQKELNKEFGTTKEDLNTNYGQWAKTKAQLEQTGETMGEQLLPVISKVAKGIEHLTQKFTHLTPTEKDVVLGLMGLATIAGPVVEAFALVKLAIGGVSLVLSGLPLLISPIGLAIEGLILVCAGLYEAWKHNFLGIRTIATEVWHDIVHAFEWGENHIGTVIKDTLMIITGITNPVIGVVELIHEAWKHNFLGIKTDTLNTWKDIKRDFHNSINDIKNSVDNWWRNQKQSWQNGYNSLKKSATNWWNSQKTIYENQLRTIKNTWDKCKTATIESWNHITQSVSKALHNILRDIENTPFAQGVARVTRSIVHLITNCKNAVVEISEALVRAVVHRLENMGREAEQIGENIINRFERLWNRMKTDTENAMGDVEREFSQKWSSLCGWFSTNVEKPAEYIARMLGKFGRYIENGINTARRVFDNGWNTLCNWFSTSVERPARYVEGMLDRFGNYIGTGIRNATNCFDRGWNTLCNWFTGAVERPVNDVGNMASSFGNAIGQLISSATRVFQQGWNGLCNWFSTAANDIVTDVKNLGGSMMSAGESIINDLLTGLTNAWSSVTNWISNQINGLANRVSNAASHIVGDITSWGNDGSHATGLAYVPWDGYRAELHKGEMVLTAEQAEAYKQGNNGAGGGNTYNFYSPEPIDPFEAKRQMIDASRKLANGFY